MSQVQGADAVSTTTAQNIASTVATQVVLGNSLQSPFGTAKAFVMGSCYFTLGSTPATLRAQIFRNPNGENVLVADSGLTTQGLSAGLLGEIHVNGTDAIPDGRPCQYALVITFTGGGTNVVTSRQTIFAMLLSG